MVAGIFEKSKRLRKAFFFIQKTPMSAQPMAAYQNRGMLGAQSAPRDYRFEEPEKTIGHLRGQGSPEAPTTARCQSCIVSFRASSKGLFPSRLYAEQPANPCQRPRSLSLGTGASRHSLCVKQGSGVDIDDNTAAQDSPVDRSLGPKLAAGPQVIEPFGDAV